MKKKQIIIEIPDDLSPEGEAFEISQKLNYRLLESRTDVTKPKEIGSRVDIKDLETQIIIKRVTKEKPIEMVGCSCCGCDYEKGKGTPVYTNYGGMIRKLFYCSKDCANQVAEILGDRGSLKKTKIRPAFLY